MFLSLIYKRVILVCKLTAIFVMKKTFSIISLGCPRNLVDSERLVSEFAKKGYRFQEGVPGADTVIINTCTFIEDAKKESIEAILDAIDLKNRGKAGKIIVAGCLSQRYKNELTKEFKEVDEFRGVMEFNNQSDTVCRRRRHTVSDWFAYIKISEGCANRCSYCVIPSIKGRYRSRSVESIKKEANELIDRGAREIILIGQDTSLYGVDIYNAGARHAVPLQKLLKELANISKDIWIRLLYLHPANLDRDVIKLIRDNRNMCRYIDLPIEHVNDNILRRMGRRIKKKGIISLIEYIRKELPGAAIRTSLIVGFPGETDKELKELASFVKEMKFERLGVFKYSREEGTIAYDYKNQVPEKEKQTRFDEIMTLQQEISKDANEKFKGRNLKVLIEERSEDYYLGRTEYDAHDIDGLVYVKGKNLKIGSFVDVKITDTYEYDLIGKPCPTPCVAEGDTRCRTKVYSI